MAIREKVLKAGKKAAKVFAKELYSEVKQFLKQNPKLQKYGQAYLQEARITEKRAVAFVKQEAKRISKRYKQL